MSLDKKDLIYLRPKVINGCQQLVDQNGRIVAGIKTMMVSIAANDLTIVEAKIIISGEDGQFFINGRVE